MQKRKSSNKQAQVKHMQEVIKHRKLENLASLFQGFHNSEALHIEILPLLSSKMQVNPVAYVLCLEE